MSVIYHNWGQNSWVESLVTMASPDSRRHIKPTAYFALSKAVHKLSHIVNKHLFFFLQRVVDHLEIEQQCSDKRCRECSGTSKACLVHSRQCSMCFAKGVE